MPDRPDGPQPIARPHATPSGVFPSSDNKYNSSFICPPSPQPTQPQMPLRPSVIPAMPGMPLPDVWQPNTKRAAAKTAAADSSSGTGNKHPFLVILTKQQAMDIYSMRSPHTTRDPKLQAVAGKSSMVAEMYGVSPKTIRDIWNRKTWAQVTRPMWTAEEVEDYNTEQAQAKLPPAEREALRDELKKRRGRPPGSKDSRPRRRRIKWGEDGSELTPTEGVMYVTIDGTVQVQPIPQAPKVHDAPPTMMQGITRTQSQLSPHAQPTVQTRSAHALQAAQAYHPMSSHEEETMPCPEVLTCMPEPGRPMPEMGMLCMPEPGMPLPEPGARPYNATQDDCEDYSTWNDEPGCPQEEETVRNYHHQPQPKKEEEDDSEQRPRALMGPIGDDFFEQPACFDPTTHNANTHMTNTGFCAASRPAQEALPAPAARPACHQAQNYHLHQFAQHQAHHHNHHQHHNQPQQQQQQHQHTGNELLTLLSKTSSSGSCNRGNLSLDWAGWFPGTDEEPHSARESMFATHMTDDHPWPQRWGHMVGSQDETAHSPRFASKLNSFTSCSSDQEHFMTCLTQAEQMNNNAAANHHHQPHQEAATGEIWYFGA